MTGEKWRKVHPSALSHSFTELMQLGEVNLTYIILSVAADHKNENEE